MDSFEWNKIAGAVLASLLLMMVIGIGVGGLYKPVKPAKPGYVIAVEEAAKPGETKAAAVVDVNAILASASPDKGADVFKKCAVCHTVEKGGPNKTGPNLWGIVGNKHAHLGAGFAYSDIFKSKAGEPWTFQALFDYLDNPKAAMPGNKMAFAGLSKPEDRANVIAFLNKNSDAPLPLPAAK